MLNPGDKVGAYEIVAPLRAGGMAELMLGRRVGAGGFNRLVAIKAVHEQFVADERMHKRFMDEARLSSLIVHPNVVHVEDLCERQGRLYLVMEYVHGATLSQFADELAKMQRRLNVETAVAIVGAVAEGLHAAHEVTDEHGSSLGVVHRDVSPENVLISQTGHVKLIDFGIAKAKSRSHATTTGHVVGKMRYIAPEQALGDPVDRRADVYALGIILWELLTTRPLFKGGLEMLEVEMRPKVHPPSRYNKVLPPALDAAVLAALQLEPSQRPQTALEFRSLLFNTVPRAAGVDAPKVSELLLSVLGEQLAKAADEIPSVRPSGREPSVSFEILTAPLQQAEDAAPPSEVIVKAPPARPILPAMTPTDFIVRAPVAKKATHPSMIVIAVVVTLAVALGVLAGILLGL